MAPGLGPTESKRPTSLSWTATESCSSTLQDFDALQTGMGTTRECWDRSRNSWQTRTSKHDCGTVVLPVARLIEVFRYSTGTKLAGIVYVQRIACDFYRQSLSLSDNVQILKELCVDATLKNVVIMIHEWEDVGPKAERGSLKVFNSMTEQGAQLQRFTDASQPARGVLRTILEGRPVVPVVPKLAERRDSDIKGLEKSMQEAADQKVQELRRELEEQKRRAQQEADTFKSRIAEVKSREESIREDIIKGYRQKLEEQKRKADTELATLMTHVTATQSEESARRDTGNGRYQKLEEQRRRAEAEADALRTRIAEMQSKQESIRQDIIKGYRQKLEEQKRKADQEVATLMTHITSTQSEESARKDTVNGSHQHLEEQRRRAEAEADALRTRLAEMQSKQESVRKDIVNGYRQKMEEQRKKAYEETDALRTRIAEMQSKLEEGQYGSSGKSSADESF